MNYFQHKRLYSPSSYQYNPQNNPQTRKKKVFFWLLIGFIFFCIVFGFWFTKNILIGLPDVSKIKDMIFSEATVIQDRNGEVLYRLFDENREYVVYS